jgi:hypothetical protein
MLARNTRDIPTVESPMAIMKRPTHMSKKVVWALKMEAMRLSCPV